MMKRRFFCFFIAIVMTCSLIVMNQVNNSQAASRVYNKLESLKSEYPSGRFWNHKVTSSSNTADALAKNNNESYADSVTTSRCFSHNMSYAPLQGYDCNYFDGGVQCDGFAKRIFNRVFDQRVSQLGKRTDTANLRVGDFVRFKFRHSAIVYSINGDAIRVVECNPSGYGAHGNCEIRWNGSEKNYDKANISYFTRASNYDSINNNNPDTTKPVISNVKISNITSSSYTVSCTATDNVGIDRVQFPTWTGFSGQDDLASSWWTNTSVRGSKNGNTYSFTVHISAHNNETGRYYTYIYAYDKAGNYQVYHCPTLKLYYYSIAPVTLPKAPSKSTLSVHAGTSYEPTRFIWTLTKYTVPCDLRIYQGKNLYKYEHNIRRTHYSITLPEGRYSAWICSGNFGHEHNSNLVHFTVVKGVPKPKPVVPKKVSPQTYKINSVVWRFAKGKKKSISTKWKSVTNAKYEVWYKLTGKKKWSKKRCSKTAYTIKHLKKKKKYRVKIRAYNKSSSAFSSTKTVKTK